MMMRRGEMRDREKSLRVEKSLITRRGAYVTRNTRDSEPEMMSSVALHAASTAVVCPSMKGKGARARSARLCAGYERAVFCLRRRNTAWRGVARTEAGWAVGEVGERAIAPTIRVALVQDRIWYHVGEA